MMALEDRVAKLEAQVAGLEEKGKENARKAQAQNVVFRALRRLIILVLQSLDDALGFERTVPCRKERKGKL